MVKKGKKLHVFALSVVADVVVVVDQKKTEISITRGYAEQEISFRLDHGLYFSNRSNGKCT